MDNSLEYASLDKTQKKFCEDSAENICLLAPAGCGKTQSILWRCLKLYENQKSPDISFLILTFTRVAAEEIQIRLDTQPEFSLIHSRVKIMTLNAYGWRYLKKNIPFLTLINTKDKKERLILSDLSFAWERNETLKTVLTKRSTRRDSAKKILDIIDSLKSLGFRHDKCTSREKVKEYFEWLRENGLEYQYQRIIEELKTIGVLSKKNNFDDFFDDFYDIFFTFWVTACVRMKETKKCTMEDQKYWFFLRLIDQIEAKKILRHKTYLMVDEFQDISLLDLNLINALVKVRNADLTIIGDDDQAIFEWRSASPHFIRHPEIFFKKPFVIHTLGINYRSPKNIVKFSQKLIKNNRNRVKKNVKPNVIDDAEIEVLSFSDYRQTIDYVISLIKCNNTINESPNNIAIISRKISQIIPYQVKLVSENIPYFAAEDLNLLLSKTFNDLKFFLILKDEYTARRIDVISDLLFLCDKVKRYPLFFKDRRILENYLIHAGPHTIAEGVHILGKSSESNYRSFSSAIQTAMDTTTVSEFLDAISGEFEGFKKDFGKSADDLFFKNPPFLFLSEYAQRYDNDFVGFFNDIEKVIRELPGFPESGDEDSDGQLKWKTDLNNEIRLMTAYRTKGKEFDIVIILDCNQDIWPIKLAKNSENLEEERRLFYVAFTRARKKIVLCVNKKIKDQSIEPSQYISEMGLRTSEYDPAAQLKKMLDDGRECFYRGDFLDALDFFSKVLGLNPHSEETIWYLGLTYLKLYWLDTAESYLKELIEDHPDFIVDNPEIKETVKLIRKTRKKVEKINAIGEAHFNSGNYERAYERFHEASLLNQESADLWNRKGATLIKLHKKDDAMRCLNHAINLDENHEKAKHNLAIAKRM